MSKPTTKRRKSNNHEGKDFISELPNDILHRIISSLSTDEALRTSILSKRWIHLWKNTMHLDFDCTHMRKPLSRIKKPKATTRCVKKYGKIVNNVLNQHIGNLTSCYFKHLPQSLYLGDLKTWVEFVVERKKLTCLSLECQTSIHVDSKFVKDGYGLTPKLFLNLCSLELTNYTLKESILFAFKSCEKLKILKLKKMAMENSVINGILKNCFGLEKFSLVRSNGFNRLKIQNKNLKVLELLWLSVKEIDVNVEDLQVVVIDSLVCAPKGFRIYSGNLLNFSSTCNPNAQGIVPCYLSQGFLKTQDILENWSHLASQSTNIFGNLLTLSIDLDLNKIREAVTLSYILTSCIHLNTLKITIPLVKDSYYRLASVDCTLPCLPFPTSMFWETREMCYCVNNKLKFVTIRGFTGKEQEVKFAKCLIAQAFVMKKMYVICDLEIVDEAKDFLSLPRGSSDLAIFLESENKNDRTGDCEK